MQGSDPPSTPLPARGVNPPSRTRSTPARVPPPMHCTPSRTRRTPSTAQVEGIEEEGPRERAKGRKAALGYVPSPSRIEDSDGSGGEQLSRCSPPNDGTEPRLTAACRCQRLLGKSLAVEGEALAPKPPPPSRPSLPSQSQLHPPDSVRTQRPIHGPPKRKGDAVSHLRSGRHAAWRRLGCAGEAEPSTTTAVRDLKLTTRLPAGA